MRYIDTDQFDSNLRRQCFRMLDKNSLLFEYEFVAIANYIAWLEDELDAAKKREQDAADDAAGEDL